MTIDNNTAAATLAASADATQIAAPATPVADNATPAATTTQIPASAANTAAADNKDSPSASEVPSLLAGGDAESAQADKAADQEQAAQDAEGKDQGESGTSEYSAFNLPEGMTLDDAKLQSALPVFKDLGLSQEQAQKLVDWEAARQSEGAAAQLQAIADYQKTNHTACMTDERLGKTPDERKQSFEYAKHGVKALSEVIGSDLQGVLKQHHIDNHPDIVRLFAALGQQHKGTEVKGGGIGNVGQSLSGMGLAERAAKQLGYTK
jgi:uncharacterized protein YdaT